MCWKEAAMSPSDRKILEDLFVHPELTFNERGAIRDLLREYNKLKEAKSWENPYSKAIAVLESASRSFEGSYG
jgi:hypothetical protein